MSEPKRALVLHLAGREPLLIAIPPEAADELAASLPELIRNGQVETVTAANGSTVAVNFAHVVAAHVDGVPGIGQIYGSPARERTGVM
jgi:hypothetical protein